MTDYRGVTGVMLLLAVKSVELGSDRILWGHWCDVTVSR